MNAGDTCPLAQGRRKSTRSARAAQDPRGQSACSSHDRTVPQDSGDILSGDSDVDSEVLQDDSDVDSEVLQDVGTSSVRAGGRMIRRPRPSYPATRMSPRASHARGALAPWPGGPGERKSVARERRRTAPLPMHGCRVRERAPAPFASRAESRLSRGVTPLSCSRHIGEARPT